MSDGRTTRLAALLVLLVLAPTALAATPTTTKTSADGTDGQEITDLAIDPSGQYAATVVAFDSTKSSATGGLLGQTPAGNLHKDIYICDHGTTDRSGSGTGCRGLRQSIGPLDTITPNYAQHVDATLADRQGKYVVGGPDERITLWQHTSDQAVWTASADDAQKVLNVSIAPDASRIVAAVGATNPATPSKIEVRKGSDGSQIWNLTLQNAAHASVRPTSLDYARSGNVLAIGTNDGILLVDPSGSAPTGDLGGIPQAQSVGRVVLSGDGQSVAAAASNGVFFAHVTLGPKPSVVTNAVFNRGFGEAAQDVAMSLDGSRFAAAAGNKVYFFRALDTSAIAEPIGDAYDAGARVSSLAYDDKGTFLVATAGNNVFAFGPNKNTPLWSFDATQTAFGALDGPLRKVVVSDDAQRVIVAGRTKMMAYGNVLGVTASLASPTGSASIAPTQTVAVALTVKNTGSLSDNYSFIVDAPVLWSATTIPDLRLDPEESKELRFNVTAPAGEAPGVKSVAVRVRSQVAEDLAARRNVAPKGSDPVSFTFTIPRSVVLNVSAPDDRLLLRQGGEQTVVVTLRNEGNAEGVVNLSTRQELTRGASWSIAFEGGDQVRVPASSSVNVNMLVTAPSDAGSGDRNIITIRAREGDAVDATDQVIAYVNAQFGAELRTNQTSWEFYPGQTQSIKLNVTNVGNTDDIYNLTQSITPASVASDWRVTIESEQVSVARGQTKQVLVTVKAVASDAREASLVLKAISQSSPDKTEKTLPLSLLTVPRPPTEPTKKGLLPGPELFLVLGAIALLALARRGGRR
ncbi:MAG TPA: hypothetical protein VM370_01780 [Candidatus Thermoplasmatota archaeon]|nr:hypothetical protein [Candidatus Thermoplasmatota archaeon]